jgi:hypothetical protein
VKFVVYRCIKDPDYFIVTDQQHVAEVRDAMCPSGGDVKKIGEYEEMGKSRVAFNETLAKNSIAHQGFYRYSATSFAAVPEAPEMPA